MVHSSAAEAREQYRRERGLRRQIENGQFITKMNRPLIIIAFYWRPWLDSNQHV